MSGGYGINSKYPCGADHDEIHNCITSRHMHSYRVTRPRAFGTASWQLLSVESISGRRPIHGNMDRTRGASGRMRDV